MAKSVVVTRRLSPVPFAAILLVASLAAGHNGIADFKQHAADGRDGSRQLLQTSLGGLNTLLAAPGTTSAPGTNATGPAGASILPPVPAAALLSRTPAPAPSSRRSPTPAPGNEAPGPAPATGTPAPGPGTRAPAPTPGEGAPGPGPSTAPAPAPRASTPAPGPGEATPAPAPTAEAPVPSPRQAPAPAPGSGAPAPAPGLGAPAPAPVSQAPTPQRSGPTPAPVGEPVASAPVPSPEASGVPVPAPELLRTQAPAPGPATPVVAPVRAPTPSSSPEASVPAPVSQAPGAQQPAKSPSALTVLSPAASRLAPSPGIQAYLAGQALPPAGPGQLATLVTFPQDSSSGVTTVSATGATVAATARDVASSAPLFAKPGTLSLVVQTAEPLSDLPASALNVQGGTVTSTAPVSGSGGRLFSVNVATAAGASFVSVATVAGIGLSNGQSTSASNTVRVSLDSTGPVPTIRSQNGYSSGPVTDPKFTIDFGEPVRATDSQQLYTLTGTTRTDVAYNPSQGIVYINAFIPPDQQNASATIQINVPAGVTSDLAGNPNTAASYSYYYVPSKPSYDTVAHTFNAVSSAAVGAAIAAPLALGSTTALGVAGSTVTAAGGAAVLHTMGSLQTFYLAGRMNVENLPSNFRQVSDAFQYTVLNIRLPWQSTGSSSSVSPVDSATQGRRLMAAVPSLGPTGAVNGTVTVPNVYGGSSQYQVTSTGLNQTGETSRTANVADIGDDVVSQALGNGDNPFETLWRSMFWLAVLVIGVTIITWALAAFFAWRRWPVPIILQEPRPQFLVLLFGVPAIAQACATLFAKGGGKEIAVGVVIVVVFPALMVLGAAYLVWAHILRSEKRRAAWVLLEDPETSEREKNTWRSKLLDLLVGPAAPEGRWIAVKSRDSKFVDHYGPLFEVNRGPPMVLVGQTYEADPVTGHCNRGRLQRVYESPLLKLGRFSLYPHHLASHNSSVELAHGIATAILLQAFTGANSWPQVILLLVINVLFLIWLRIIRPSGDRTELIMAMLGTLSSMGIYICGIILLSNPDASPGFRDRIGIAMIILGLWSVISFFVGFMSTVASSWPFLREFYLWLRPSKDHGLQFAKVVQTAMVKDEHILARKYADRWMLKALGSGLFGREVFRREVTDPRQRFYDVVMAARMAGLNRNKKAPRRVWDTKFPVDIEQPAPGPLGNKSGTAAARLAGAKWLGSRRLGEDEFPKEPASSGSGSASPSSSSDHGHSSSRNTPSPGASDGRMGQEIQGLPEREAYYTSAAAAEARRDALAAIVTAPNAPATTTRLTVRVGREESEEHTAASHRRSRSRTNVAALRPQPKWARLGDE